MATDRHLELLFGTHEVGLSLVTESLCSNFVPIESTCIVS